MNLIVWIFIGLAVNLFLLKDDLEDKNMNLVTVMVAIIIRSVMGGVLSNYLFAGGLGSLDFPTFALTGIAPLILLLVVQVYNSKTELKKT